MVSVTSASRYHPRYQSRSSMYIRGLIPRNFAELAEAVPIESNSFSTNGDCLINIDLCTCVFQKDPFEKLLDIAVRGKKSDYSGFRRVGIFYPLTFSGEEQ